MFLSKTLFLFSMLALGRADDDDVVHFEVPDELDVENPPLKCLTNADGFGGDITSDFFTVNFWYEVEYIAGADKTEMVSKIERDTTDYLLQSDLFNLPCSTPSLEARDGSRRVRRLREAVGISANPEDGHLEGVECSEFEAGDGSTECVVVSASFQLYYVEDGNNDDGLKEKFLETVEEGMDNDEIRWSDDNVVQVISVGEPKAETQNVPIVENPVVTPKGQDGGDNVGVIIGATVGALVALAAVALYRKRQSGSNDETAFTPEPSATGAEV